MVKLEIPPLGLKKSKPITMVLPKPKENHNWLVFQDIEAIYLKLAHGIGIDVAPNRTKGSMLISLIDKLSMWIFLVTCAASFISAYKGGGEDFISGCRNGTIFFGNLLINTMGIFPYLYHDECAEIIEYCNKLSRFVKIDEDRLLRKIKIVNYSKIAIPLSNFLGILFLHFVLGQWMLPFPIAFLRRFMDFEIGFLFNVTCIALINLVFWLDACFQIGSCLIFVDHVSAHYNHLSEKIQNLLEPETEDEQVNVVARLNDIGRQHTELLDIVDKFNHAFKFSLMLIEFFIVIGCTVFGVIVEYDQAEWIFGVQCLSITCICFIFPIYGQRVTQSSEDFEMVITAFRWDLLSSRDRKKVVLLKMMAQREIGMSSGGFHFSNYTQMISVSQLLLTSTFTFMTCTLSIHL